MICHLFQKLEYQSLFNFKKIIKDFKFSLSFLSILPCGKIDKPIPTIDEACWAFPICGLIIGSIVFISFYIANYFNLPIYLCSIIAILSGIFVTGGFHEDGLADTSDGIFGGKTISSKLKIMKMSNIGTFGVISLFFILTLRIFIMSEYELSLVSFFSFISISAISRMAMVIGLYLLPAAKKNGLGYHGKISKAKPIALGSIFSALLLFFCSVSALSFFITFIVIAFFLFIILFLAKQNIKGQTGDVCGACQIVTETFGWYSIVHFI